MTMKTVLMGGVLALFGLTACGGGHHHHDYTLETPPAGVTAEAEFVGVNGDPIGQAMVTQGPNGMLIRLALDGLEPGFHGIHLHQVGDCSDHENGFRASGSHINPEGREHGLMNPAGPDAADLPNLYVHHGGHAVAELFSYQLPNDMAMDADGFAIVIHENQDDHQTQPIGGAGPRVACAAFQ